MLHGHVQVDLVFGLQLRRVAWRTLLFVREVQRAAALEVQAKAVQGERWAVVRGFHLEDGRLNARLLQAPADWGLLRAWLRKANEGRLVNLVGSLDHALAV